jgi:glycosyltransferase involved in cell wall biosynthesis
VLLLVEALNAQGVDTELVSVADWDIRKAFRTHAALRRAAFDVVQIHYPSLGIGTKLGPQVNALLRRCVITLHEASRVHVLRQLALIPFCFYPRHVIFFSEFERNFGLQWAPWLSSKSSNIPPPSNIRKHNWDGPRRLDEIVSFGLIRPNNGHSEMIHLAALIKAAGVDLTVRIIGTPQSEKFVPFFEHLKAESVGLPVIWDSGLSEEEVARKLASAAIAYFPYPGGAAELRSSLKAALLNGLAIVTTRGSDTPANLDGVVEFCDSPADALTTIQSLIANRERRDSLARRAGEYVKDWTWERTAARHAELYQLLINEERSRGAATPLGEVNP